LAVSPRIAQAEGACDDLGIAVEGQLDPTWTEQLERVCDALRDQPDVDHGAHVRVVAGDPVIVLVKLADGRTAHRAVPSVGALERTIDALLTVPPTFEPGPDAPPSPPSPPQVGPSSPLPMNLRPSERPPELPPPPPRPVHWISAELGLLATGRLNGKPLYASVGLEAWAGLNLSNWILALTARYDGYQTEPTLSPSGFQMTTVGGGLDFTRRIEVTPIVDIDLGGGVSILEETQSADTVSGSGDDEANDVRIVAETRAHFGGRGPRFTLELEAEISPLRVRHAERLDPGLPTLPSFGGCLGAGISWQSP
jgi:hypothetical protein